MHLVIGGRGLIGTAVCRELKERNEPFIATTRDGAGRNMLKLDLLKWAEGSGGTAPFAPDGTVYLVAAIPGFAATIGNPVSWIVNRDAPIELARFYREQRAFVVFISSDVVNKEYDIEYSAYPRQKAEVESYIQSIDGAIVRPGKVPTERAPELAKVIVDVGLARRPGLTRWP